MRTTLRRLIVLAALSGLCVSVRIAAQVVAPAPAATDKSEVIRLTPFEVQADSDKSYGALNSNTVTAFNVALDRLPISADIFTQAFMDDVAATNVEQLLQEYSVGAGYATSDPGAAADNVQALDRNGTSYIQLRGLNASTNVRDGLLMLGTLNNPGSTGVGYSSTWDLERVEVINGPQALLYGWGGGGGIINMVGKTARLGKKPFGTFKYIVDNYGHKGGQFDYGVGTERFALRLAFVNETVGGRRIWVGGPLSGQYIQFAYKLGDTVIRAQAAQTKFNRFTSNGVTLNAGGATVDSRNGQSLHYLMATDNMNTNQLGGPSGAGVIANGKVNWGNIDSLEGQWGTDLSVIDHYMVTAESRWSSWLSTKISAGYSYSDEDRVNNTFAIFSPNVSTNTTRQWAMGMTGGTPAGDQDKPSMIKAFRGNVLMTHSLFGGRVKSQTILGGDFMRGDTGQQSYGYYLADANFKPVINQAQIGNSTQGRTVIPALFYSIQDGPVKYPLWAPRNATATYNGNNYVRMIINQVDPSKISPDNPLGVSVVGGANYSVEHMFEKGIYGTNYAQWFDDKIDTIAGFRYSDAYDRRYYAGASAAGPTILDSSGKHLSFNFGADFKLTNWLRPYFSVSDSYQPSLFLATDPYGASLGTAKAIGEEVGIKMTNPSGTISGSLAVYHVNSSNESFNITSTLLFDINPSGLNGRYGSPSVWIMVDRKSSGAQLQVTAAPSSNWRLRAGVAFIDGRIGTDTSYPQLYNDQFYANAAGQVTYRDGTVVTVNPNANGILASGSGGIPLTITAMNTPGNRYYANPLPVSGAITSGSAVAAILRTIDPQHGPVLTGAVGLPISKLQINPGFVPAGVIPTSRSGEKTTGYPLISFNFTGAYTVPSERLKGLKIGTSVRVGWLNRNYYYFPAGPNAIGVPRTIFSYPTQTVISPLLGYTRKLGRYAWSSQINMNNVFNHYHLLITPNSVNGFAGPNGATFDQQPRSWTWVNSLSF